MQLPCFAGEEVEVVASLSGVSLFSHSAPCFPFLFADLGPPILRGLEVPSVFAQKRG